MRLVSDWSNVISNAPHDIFAGLLANQITPWSVWFPWRLARDTLLFSFSHKQYLRSAASTNNFSFGNFAGFWALSLSKIMMNNIEQLLEAAKILEKRDEGKILEIFVYFGGACRSHAPFMSIFRPTLAKKRCSTPIKMVKKTTRRSPSYR